MKALHIALRNTLTLTCTMALISSCNIEVPEEATLNINESSSTDALESYDYEYGDTLGDNFQDYNVYENNDGFYMDDGGSGMQMPKQRPDCHKGKSSQYQGKGVNGASMAYSPGQSSPWKFSSSPTQLLNYGDSTGRMIGVMENGVPVYAQSTSNMSKNLDQYGGTYSQTDDFPNGVYHYVIIFQR